MFTREFIRRTAFTSFVLTLGASGVSWMNAVPSDRLVEHYAPGMNAVKFQRCALEASETAVRAFPISVAVGLVIAGVF